MRILSAKNNLLALLLISLVLSFSSCKECDDPCNVDCDNYDPCCGQTEADASFKIYELLSANPRLDQNGFDGSDLVTDTILSINFARFRANKEADYYEWRISNDTRVWNSREFDLRFSSLPPYTPIDVQLKVYKKTDRNCFPNANDTAIFKRNLVTVPLDSSKILGRYDGFVESKPNESSFFSIQTFKDAMNQTQFSLSGITPKCSTDTDINLSLAVYPAYKGFYVQSQGTLFGCCLGLSAFGEVQNRRELTMVFGRFLFSRMDSCSRDPNNDAYLNDVFIGIKQ
jgi:hypothetical protein